MTTCLAEFCFLIYKIYGRAMNCNACQIRFGAMQGACPVSLVGFPGKTIKQYEKWCKGLQEPKGILEVPFAIDVVKPKMKKREYEMLIKLIIERRLSE